MGFLSQWPGLMWLLSCFGILKQLNQGQSEVRQNRVASQFVRPRQNAHAGEGIVGIDLRLGGEDDPDAFDTGVKVFGDFIHDIVATV
jgi:hypothetical protein